MEDELSPEEMVNRMTDEELLGLTPPSSRPGSSGQKKSVGLSALAQLRPSSSTGRDSLNSRPASAGIQGQDQPKQARLAPSASTPVVGILRPSTAAEVKAQRKQSFHFKRQRRWLEVRSKQHCLSFTEQEIIDFRRFFDALAKGKKALPMDTFEDMLVCLDLAKSRKDIRAFLELIQHTRDNNEIFFEDFLKAFESQLDQATMGVLKLLLQGTYDSRDLDYPTFISERRRELILSATGARGSSAQGPSAHIVRTFSDLLEDRCYHDFGGSNKGGEDGVLLMGGLGTMWKVACVQHGLARTMRAEERIANYKKSVPLSPRTVVNNIVKASSNKTVGVHRMGGTLIIEADRISA